MTIAYRLPTTALQNIRNQFQPENFAWIAPELNKLRKHWLLIACIIPISICAQVLYEVDYEDHDITARGIRIFTWLPKVLGRKPRTFSTPAGENDELFPQGIKSVDPLCVKQRRLEDCKFLAAVSSLIRTESGKQTVFSMITKNDDGSFTVTFPGLYAEPITVAPLTAEEKHYYSKTDGIEGQFKGQWLPVLEKAYGAYRIEHQDWWKSNIRYLQHALLDFRFTSTPRLQGFGASFGAADEVGAQVLGGGKTKNIETSSYELGSFGLGKGHVTWRQLRSWVNKPAAVREIENEQNAALVAAMKHSSIVVASTEINGDAMAYHLFPGHAYAVLNYNARTRMLTLKDPLCSDMWDPSTQESKDGKEDGLFEISLNDFNQLFSRLRVQVNDLSH